MSDGELFWSPLIDGATICALHTTLLHANRMEFWHGVWENEAPVSCTNTIDNYIHKRNLVYTNIWHLRATKRKRVKKLFNNYLSKEGKKCLIRLICVWNECLDWFWFGSNPLAEWRIYRQNSNFGCEILLFFGAVDHFALGEWISSPVLCVCARVFLLAGNH